MAKDYSIRGISVLSFDYDGCLADRGTDILSKNEKLIKDLKENPALDRIVFIGSNRQSKQDDDKNTYGNENGSSYIHIPRISLALEATFDPFLLADVYNEASPGTAFSEATDSTHGPTHKGWLHDESKITLIYCQMQKIAVENPLATIDFEFYDDKEDILLGLQTFFLENKHLIPANTRLHLYQYDGSNKVTVCEPIAGTGRVNQQYAQTIRAFGDVVLTFAESQGSLCNTDGNDATPVEIKKALYNANFVFNANNYKDHLVRAHDSAVSLSAHFFIDIVAANKMKVLAGIFIVAGLAALTVGTLGIGGVIAALAGTAAIATASLGGAAIVGGLAAGFFGLFAPQGLEKRSASLPLLDTPPPAGSEIVI